MYTRKGFSLIEILVVIAIIGTLSALLLPNFMDARARARDTQRKNDLKSIQKALEMSKLDQSPQLYPLTIPNPGVAFASVNGNAYIKIMPKDPTANTGYEYTRLSAGISYVLCACLENIADPELVAGNCPGGKICTGTKSYQLTNP